MPNLRAEAFVDPGEVLAMPKSRIGAKAIGEAINLQEQKGYRVGAPRESGRASDGDSQRGTHLLHPVVAKTAKTLSQCTDRNTLHRIEIDSRTTRDGVRTSLEHDLAQKPSDVRRTGSYQCTAKSRDCSIAR